MFVTHSNVAVSKQRKLLERNLCFFVDVTRIESMHYLDFADTAKAWGISMNRCDMKASVAIFKNTEMFGFYDNYTLMLTCEDKGRLLAFLHKFRKHMLSLEIRPIAVMSDGFFVSEAYVKDLIDFSTEDINIKLASLLFIESFTIFIGYLAIFLEYFLIILQQRLESLK